MFPACFSAKVTNFSINQKFVTVELVSVMAFLKNSRLQQDFKLIHLLLMYICLRWLKSRYLTCALIHLRCKSWDCWAECNRLLLFSFGECKLNGLQFYCCIMYNSADIEQKKACKRNALSQGWWVSWFCSQEVILMQWELDYMKYYHLPCISRSSLLCGHNQAKDCTLCIISGQ